MPASAQVALLSYLLGSIPFGLILVRVFRGEDIRRSGSGNIGATNVSRTAPVLGLVTLLLDAGKGFLAVAIAGWLGGDKSLAALCAVAGHIFPVWLRFRGGKGVATAIGGYAALAADVTAICLVVFVLLLASFRFVSLGSMTAIALFPLIAFFLHGNGFLLGFYTLSAASAVLIVFQHRDNIQRLLSGTEPRFELRRK